MSKSQEERIAALEVKIAELERRIGRLGTEAWGSSRARPYYIEAPRTILANTIICGGDGV